MQMDAGTILVEAGLINEDQLQQALSARLRKKGSLVEHLVWQGLVDEQAAAGEANRHGNKLCLFARP